jgi:O-antigen chain-terminating methyltransferase
MGNVESAELIAILREVRDRVRAGNPETAAGGAEIALPDLMPVVHARDAALGKVAAIGTVNPRRGGPVNLLVQGWKRMVARALDWHVREQVEFNRKTIACVDAAIEALNDTNRALVAFGNSLAAAENRTAAFHELAEERSRQLEAKHAHLEAERAHLSEEFHDIRIHWSEWRLGWERKLETNEIQFLRSVADLQGASQHRADLMDANYRDAIRAQHADFTAALERSANEIQQRLWADLERIRREYEGIIYSELRTLRQRAQIQAPPAVPAPTSEAPGKGALPFDYGRFAEKFRGPEEYVKNGQQFYLPYFKDCRNVLDIGCGRGEFLEMMREAGVPAGGIDLSDESVALCRHKGLEAETADLFEYLPSLAEASLDGIFCSQVVEHLSPERLPEMIRLVASRLGRGGVVAIETPNPECLAIFSTHFYLDPTHTRPVPSPLLAFYMEEFGIGRLEVHRLTPAVESMPALAELPKEFRESFFGGLDYAIIGRKL